MTPLLQRIRRLFQPARCTAPVTAAAGVLRCVRTAGPRGVCDDHRAWRSFTIPMRILWTIKPWWPNDVGRALDAGDNLRAQKLILEELEAPPQIHGKLLDDTRCCPIAEAGAFSTTFLEVVTCPVCRSRMEAAVLAGARTQQCPVRGSTGRCLLDLEHVGQGTDHEYPAGARL